MPNRVLILGAGFGGLELATRLTEALPGHFDVTLIDREDAFIFGFSKLDLMFGRKQLDAVRLPYRDLAGQGVRFLQETVTSIDPRSLRVTTDHGDYETDVMVIALGADLDPGATPGLLEAGNEFYSVEGAERLREVISTFGSGNAIIGVTSTPFKCPPAPSEAALLLDEHLRERGCRDAVTIHVVMPFGAPVPPSPATSEAILARFAQLGITFVPDRRVMELDPHERVAVSSDGTRMPFDLFLGVPVHRVPPVVEAAGMTVDGWIPVNPQTLATAYPGVYAIGDVTSVGTPKAGVFAEGAAGVVADALIARVRGGEEPGPYDGRGSCYMEFGDHEVARIDVDFLTGPSPTGAFVEPSAATAAEKVVFASSRRARWFNAPDVHSG